MKKLIAIVSSGLMASAALTAPALAQSSNENSASQDAPGVIQNQNPGVSATDRAPGQLQKSGTADSAAEVAPGQMKPSKETTASINVDAETDAELRTALSGVEVEAADDTSLDLTVGATVPATITLEPLPSDAVTAVPVYANYRFFKASDERFVIVDPNTMEIVHIVSTSS